VSKDTIMFKISTIQQNILAIFLKREPLSSSEVHSQVVESGNDVSLVTIKRELTELKEKGLITSSGAGRSVAYTISSYGRLLTDIDPKEYTSVDPDKRFGLSKFNFELFNSIPQKLFSGDEIKILDEATNIHRKNI